MSDTDIMTDVDTDVKQDTTPKAPKKEKGKLSITVKKIFWIGIAILILLLIMSIIILSTRLFQYSKADDHAISLKSNMDAELDIFSITYENASGDVTVEGADGEKVIAPGTDVEYTIRIRNTDRVAIDYELIPTVKFLSEHEIPILVRIIDPNEQYLVGDAKTWVKVGDMPETSDSATLLKGESVEYIFQWKWPFESGDNAYDTWLGDNVVNENISVEITFDLHAESNLTLQENGGFFGTSLGETILLIIFLVLLLAAIIILILSIFKRKTKEPEPTPVPVAEPAPVYIPTPMPEPEPEIVPILNIDMDAVDIPEPEPIPAPVPTPEPERQTFNGKMAYINIDVLDQSFEDGATITLALLKQKGLIHQQAKQLKILARNGALLQKAFTIEAQGASSEAKRLIAKAGGKIIFTKG